MSELDNLLKKYCPNGVNFIPLCECTNLVAGDRITTAMMDDDAEYPVMGGGSLPTGRYRDYNFENCVAISRAGSAGFVNWMGCKFWATDVCFVASQKNEGPNIKFVFYYIKSKQHDLQKRIYGGNLPKLEKNFLWKLPIPVPPTSIQNEIVRIMDIFSELTVELTTELTTELTDRKKQYEYYREHLFDIQGVQYCSLIKYFSFVRNGFVGTVTNFFTDKGNGVRYLEGTNIHNGTISDNEELYVTREFHKKHIKSELKENDVLMVQSGHIGECAVVGKKYKGSNCHALIIISNDGKYNSKFLVHYFHTRKGINALKPAITDGNLKHVLAGKMHLVRIPDVDLETQNKIVDLLDTFEKYSCAITQELATEIKARQKQYEFYRDKLLTFKELKA